MLAKEKWQIRTIAVLEKIFQERINQVAKYGHNEDLEIDTGTNVQWLFPFTTKGAAEIQEIFRQEYESYERINGRTSWTRLIREEMAEAFENSDPDLLEEELIQVAALVASLIEKIQKKREEDLA